MDRLVTLKVPWLCWHSSHGRRKLVWAAAFLLCLDLPAKSVKFTPVFGMGNTVSCCVSPESSPKVPSRLTTERLVEIQASTEVSDDTTVPYLQHIRDREVPDGRWSCTEPAWWMMGIHRQHLRWQHKSPGQSLGNDVPSPKFTKVHPRMQFCWWRRL